MRNLIENRRNIILLLSTLFISLFITGCSIDEKELHNTLSNILSTQDESFDPNEELLYDDLKDCLDKGKIPNYVEEVTVKRVVDGDTIKIEDDNGNETSVRMLLIDTPEDTKKKQYLGDIATNYAKDKLEVGSTIYIETDGKENDKYGRYLGYVWYKEDNRFKMYNREVVSEGLARVGYIYDAVRHLDVLKDAEYKAKKSQKNIWSINGYATDKGFNQNLINF
ncbi:thermonuclease family protein [Terrisporobacter sp.]|uniref:thermonuclease family protein n=1 Tax=Terrisporobacter sp. TaxID=1965305 RepID=UPI0026175B3B|nr:thermonuclease family protein [Terrisporobacter sp.]